MFFRAIAIAASIGWFAAGPAAAQILPAGYELIRVTATPFKESFPHLNNNSQLVFAARIGGNNSTLEIFLYDGRTGELTQLTNDNVHDVTPVISDSGVICWARAFGPVTPDARWLEIVTRTPDGTITRLTFNEVSDHGPSVNSLNQLAWQRKNNRGCSAAGFDVMFFDGQTIQQLTDNDWSNQTVSLNDSGDILWTEFDECFGGFNWRSRIKLYRDGQILTLMDDDDLQAQGTNVNNAGVCAWSAWNRNTGEQAVYRWDNGIRTVLTDWGERPVQNDLGDVAIQRWHDDIGLWQTWVYFKGEFIHVSDPGWTGVTPTLNNAREIAWKFGESAWLDIMYMRRLDAGDLNCDGIVDARDIEGFLQALFDPKNFPPDCDPTLADINEDGAVNAHDIEPFIELLFP